MLASGRDHFAPHPSCKFEGYYTRTQTEDGATIAVIFCWVKGAKRRQNLVLVLYSKPSQQTVPGHLRKRRTGMDVPAFKYEFFPERFDISVGTRARGQPQAFTITAPGLGSMRVTRTTIEYDIAVPENDLRLRLAATDHTPWSCTRPLEGPMGPLLHLSRLLPLNWHVRSTRSAATYTLSHCGATASGTGRAHAEKNWGASFPRGWLWAQAFSDDVSDGDARRTLCLAGGAALPGVQAYLVGYRSPVCGEWDFRPPWTVAPFVRVVRDSRAGTVELRVATWSRRLHVRIAAPPGSFVGIAAPLGGGHERDFAHESFEARVVVRAFRRRWAWTWPWATWELVEEAVLGVNADGTHCGVLEFGGCFSHEGEK